MLLGRKNSLPQLFPGDLTGATLSGQINEENYRTAHCFLTHTALVPRYLPLHFLHFGRLHRLTDHLRSKARSVRWFTGTLQTSPHGGQLQGYGGSSAQSRCRLHTRSLLQGSLGGFGFFTFFVFTLFLTMMSALAVGSPTGSRNTPTNPTIPQVPRTLRFSSLILNSQFPVPCSPFKTLRPRRHHACESGPRAGPGPRAGTPRRRRSPGSPPETAAWAGPPPPAAPRGTPSRGGR